MFTNVHFHFPNSLPCCYAVHRVAYPSAGKQKLAGPGENPEVSAIVQAFLTTPAATLTATDHIWAVNWTGDLSVNTYTTTCGGGGGGDGVTSAVVGAVGATGDSRNVSVLVAAEAPDPFVFINSVLHV